MSKILCVNRAQLLLFWFQLSSIASPFSDSPGWPSTVARFEKPLLVKGGREKLGKPNKLPLIHEKAAKTIRLAGGIRPALNAPWAVTWLTQVGLVGSRKLAKEPAATRQLAYRE